jgi:hypothetical protein
MPALVAGIHVLKALVLAQDVDGRNKPGHDCGAVAIQRTIREMF